MIVPPTVAGVVFSQAVDGNIRDPMTRSRLSDALQLSSAWAQVRQVHGATVCVATAPGDLGDADALWTTLKGLPVAVFTADCFGVVLRAEEATGVAHAGWRGVASGVVRNLVAAMSGAGYPPHTAVIGPGIGPCCFEVGPEVADLFPGHVSTTTWGSTSVDLIGRVIEQLDGVEVLVSGGCTRHDPAFFSHRRDATSDRLVALGWLP